MRLFSKQQQWLETYLSNPSRAAEKNPFSPKKLNEQNEKRPYQSIAEEKPTKTIRCDKDEGYYVSAFRYRYYYTHVAPPTDTAPYTATSPLLTKHDITSSTANNIIPTTTSKNDYSSTHDTNTLWSYDNRGIMGTLWLSQVWLYLSYFLLSSRQKEKSTPRTLILRAKRKGIKLLCSIIFIIISLCFIQRFITHYFHFEIIPSETAADLIYSIPSTDHIKHQFLTFAAKPHLAGSDQDRYLAEYLQRTWSQQYGLKHTTIETYYPTVNYPSYRRLAVTQAPTRDHLYEAILDTDMRSENDTTGRRSRETPAFHAYSGNGNVTGPLVYVNYGTKTDFQHLVERGVPLNGTIALIRQDEDAITKGMKVKMAEDHGCIGVVLFSDMSKRNDSELQELLDNHVERGSVEYTSYGVGDPFTPNFAATENITRMPYEQLITVPKIPSLPISWKDARPFFKILEGHGFREKKEKSSSLFDEWSYYSGPSEALVNLVNLNEYQIKPVWNVISRIEGSEYPDRVVMIGAHRDAWSYGAVDSSSGSAVLMELVRTIGVLVSRGWRPKRTLMIASWDAREYGAVGSTEWLEDNASWLKDQLVAYLNIDYAISGQHFTAQASPLLSRLLYQVTNEVIDPQTSQTVYQRWKKESRRPQGGIDHNQVSNDNESNSNISSTINALSSSPLPTLTHLLEPDLDHSAFFFHLGVSSLSIGFRGEKDSYFVPHHSNFDTTQRTLSSDNIDPLFEYHQTLTRIWGLLVLRLVSDPILPMMTHDYTNSMMQALQQLNNGATATATTASVFTASEDEMIEDQSTANNDASDCFTSTFPFLSSVLPSLSYTCIQFDTRMEKWARQLIVKKKHVSRKLQERVAEANDRLMRFERAFCDEAGLSPPESRWLRHRVFGPHGQTGKAVQFPGLVEAVDEGDVEKIQWAEERIGRAFIEAERVLKGQSAHG